MQIEHIYKLAADDLACYGIALWPGLEVASHHNLMIEKIEKLCSGRSDRLRMSLPPRHGKTLIGSGLSPAFYLGKYPDRSIILITYEQELANELGRRVRNFVSSPIHRRIFPDCRITRDSNSVHRFNTTAGGSFYAVGRGGPITGRGAHLLIIDDPIKNSAEARSETIRRTAFEWWREVVRTRLQSGGAIFLIGTRWHEDDLFGRIQRQPESELWDELCLAAIAEHDESFRREGEALWPERYPLSELKKIRNDIGSAAFITLYQQRPTAAEGVIFRRDWWRSYRDRPTFTRIVQSWDTGFKTGCDNDYSVCTTWGVNASGYYLLSLWRGKIEFPELKRRVAWLAAEWKPNVILVEDRASGQSLIQELRTMTRYPIRPIKVDTDKVTRAHAITPLIEAGKVFLPESAPWLNEYVDELAAFPNGLHDDAVDSTTQALNYLREQSENYVWEMTVRL
jgi:predicted phage terminase large subunit-like protein